MACKILLKEIEQFDNIYDPVLLNKVIKTEKDKKRFEEIVSLWHRGDEEYGIVYTIVNDSRYRKRALRQVYLENC